MDSLHQPGDVVGDRYQIMTPIGYGSTSITYRAQDLMSQKFVAIKALSLRQITDWKILELFEREARVLENLSHPGIPQYLNHFYVDAVSDRRFYLVQELAIGKSLAALVKQGWRASELEVRQIAIQVLKILTYLHWLTPPVIHRDIKPQNLIRRADGQLFLVDFGAVQAAYRNTLTAGGTFVGTLGYMPPEQFRGRAFFASDLYALGGTLLFLLTHRCPIDLPYQRLKVHFRDCVQVSEQFADWLEKMLEPSIEDRFHSAEEALDALRVGATTAIAARTHETAPIAPPMASAPSLDDAFYDMLLLRPRRPKGSRIVCDRRVNQFIIKIPAKGVRNVSGFKLLLFSLLTGISGVFPLLAPILAPAIMPSSWLWLISLLLGIYGLNRVGYYLFDTTCSSMLDIDSHLFELSWRWLFLKYHQYGQTTDIEMVRFESRTGARGHRTACILWEGVKKHGFGEQLTPVEQSWLVGEINDFLKQQRWFNHVASITPQPTTGVELQLLESSTPQSLESYRNSSCSKA